MKILLDENFPLALVAKLREEGREVDHIILMGLRGTPDSAIVDLLKSDEFLFLTSDNDFLGPPITRSAIILSHVSQNLPLDIRVDLWLRAVREFFSREWTGRLFEVFDDGRLALWKSSES